MVVWKTTWIEFPCNPTQKEHKMICACIYVLILYIYIKKWSQKNTEHKQQNTQTHNPQTYSQLNPNKYQTQSTLKYLKLIYLYPPHPIPNLILVSGWTNPSDKFYTLNLRCISPGVKIKHVSEHVWNHPTSSPKPHLPTLITLPYVVVNLNWKPGLDPHCQSSTLTLLDHWQEWHSHTTQSRPWTWHNPQPKGRTNHHPTSGQRAKSPRPDNTSRMMRFEDVCFQMSIINW